MVQVVKCKCGEVFAACVEPECYEDKEWMKSVRDYSKQGYKIEMKENGTWKFGACECQSKQQDPFVENQLPLF